MDRERRVVGQRIFHIEVYFPRLYSRCYWYCYFCFCWLLIKVAEAMLVVVAASPAGHIVIIRLLRQSTNLIAIQY